LDLPNENIKNTAYWCLNLDQGELISDEKAFPEASLFDFIIGSNTNEQFNKIINQMRVLISDVIEIKRSRFLDSYIGLNPRTLRGRALAFSPFFTCCDGIAASESRGLLDETNQPLKAFWIDLVVNLDSIEPLNLWESNKIDNVLLISWIPEKYINIIDYSISENGDESLYWLDN